jgi:hypothetical protein
MKATTPERLVAKVSKTAWLETPARRFQTFKSAPKGVFKPWWTAGWSLGVEDFVLSGTSRFMEVLLTFSNEGEKEFVIRAEDITMVCGKKHVSPWEILQVGVVDTYDDIVQKFMPPSLPAGKVRRLKQERAFCPLPPGGSTWAIFIFEVPKKPPDCYLAVGKAPRIKIQ